jgi:broad specificity phosphatase PhoE
MCSVVRVTAPPERALPLRLVRHGETNWNALHLIQGHDDTSRLTDKGRRQAYEVAHTLLSEDFDLIVASDLSRAAETASIIAGIINVPIEHDVLLRERNFGVLEGQTSALLENYWGIEDDMLTDPDAHPDEGESFRDVVQRSITFLNKAYELWPTQRLLLVSHGGTIRALRAAAEHKELQNMDWDRVGNCSLWTIPPLPAS